jgi:hypothetical protein
MCGCDGAGLRTLDLTALEESEDIALYFSNEHL